VAAIGVFCGSSTAVDRTYLDLARAVGTEVARRGHTLVSGGGRVGMMGAVVTAARAGGGRTVGVIPEILYGREVADTESDELIVTTDMAERKERMVERSDAFLALPGGLGTMDELFEVWTTAHLGLHDKPIVLLSPDHFYAGLLSYVDTLVEHRFLGAGGRDRLHVVHTPVAALDVVDAALRCATPPPTP
jgi:uncharacterized protein (TIGR00730 family)